MRKRSGTSRAIPGSSWDMGAGGEGDWIYRRDCVEDRRSRLTAEETSGPILNGGMGSDGISKVCSREKKKTTEEGKRDKFEI